MIYKIIVKVLYLGALVLFFAIIADIYSYEHRGVISPFMDRYWYAGFVGSIYVLAVRLLEIHFERKGLL